MKNIVLLVVDTLRAKDIRGDEAVAPFLSSMMEEGDNIENYYATAPWTAPSHASIFTGLMPSEHGTTSKDPTFESKNNLVYLLKEKGYYTKAISDNYLVSSSLGFSEEFDEFQEFGIENKPGKIYGRKILALKIGMRNGYISSRRSFERKIRSRFYLSWTI
jgi:arylsulfatase A-like enzyme